MLACGPMFNPGGVLISFLIMIVFKPLAYYGFIHAFRFRVSRAIPMTRRQAWRLAGLRAGLGAAIVIPAAGAFSLIPQYWNISWVFLYITRVVLWFLIGRHGAGLRGRRLIGWTISGTLINAAFDAAIMLGAFAGVIAPVLILFAIAGFISALDRIGARDSLTARFRGDLLCIKCQYNLTGNLSGICPECGTPVNKTEVARKMAAKILDREQRQSEGWKNMWK